MSPSPLPPTDVEDSFEPIVAAPRRVRSPDDWSRVSEDHINDLVNADSVFVSNADNSQEMAPPPPLRLFQETESPPHIDSPTANDADDPPAIDDALAGVMALAGSRQPRPSSHAASTRQQKFSYRRRKLLGDARL